MDNVFLDNYKAYNYIANTFYQQGMKLPLQSLFYGGIHSFLEEAFSEYKNEVKSLIKNKPYIFDIGFINSYNNDNTIVHKIKKKPNNAKTLLYEQNISVTQSKIKFVFKLLKCMFTENFENTQSYLDNFISSINQSPSKQLMTYLKIGIDIFPEKEGQFIEKIKNDAIKASFEKKLLENTISIEEDEKYKAKHKLKI